MFSDVSLYPSHGYRVKPGYAPPMHQLAMYQGPNRGEVSVNMDAIDFSRDRHKYSKRPIVPYLTSVPPEVVLSRIREDEVVQQSIIPEPATKTIEIQTMYRESDAQTNPYTPDVIIPPGENPELLQLNELSYGHGLPANLRTVEYIDRLRQRRAFEASLPPMSNDPAVLELRRKMIDEQQKREWAHREAEIIEVQEARLEALKNALYARNDEREAQTKERLQNLWKEKVTKKEEDLNKIQSRRIKALRKLTNSRKNVEASREHRDIIKDYSGYGSTVYAPRTRDGIFPERSIYNVEVSVPALSSDAIMNLETTMGRRLTKSLNATIQDPQMKTLQTKTPAERKEAQIRAELEKMDTILHAPAKSKKHISELTIAQKVEKPPPRPPTPTLQPPEEDDEKTVAVIFLQKLIRGRSIQNQMFEGKTRRQELIRELRIPEPKDTEEEDYIANEKEQAIESTIAQFEGESMGAALDYLAKELVRTEQLRRIQLLARAAIQTRHAREREESVRRQAEERERIRAEAQYNQVIRVHHQTVQTMMEDILEAAIENTSTRQAFEYALQPLPPAANERFLERRNDPRLLVRDMVSNFLLPEVERLELEQRGKLDERKYLLAAHKATVTVIEDIEDADEIHSRHSSAGGV
eukprot:TRINITY_DN804_c0_g1_i5.p1 TRINITY_DN804_c0_g1~~TRINITY_DN804_c0_g1_i5.p1  ORF type:complete len:639 (+),score=167.37 TRINITY_DN804_c0_g1_i5:136-2052(+)